jgi:hypothetical protein
VVPVAAGRNGPDRGRGGDVTTEQELQGLADEISGLAPGLAVRLVVG